MSDYKYKAGTLLMLETGEYSDRSVEGIYVTLCDLDLAAEARAWAEVAFEKQKALYMRGDQWVPTPDHSSFTAWLCTEQKIVQAVCHELHIGSYNELSIGTDISMSDIDERAEEAVREQGPGQ